MIALLASSDVILNALIVAIGTPAAALLIAWQLNRQRRTEKKEDYARLEEVAKKAEEARIALAKENKVVADKAAEQQKQVADVAAGAAQLLKDAQEKTLAGTDEVARLQAGDKSDRPFQTGRLLAVVISHPSGLRREILLDAVPRIGDHILLRGVENRQPSKVADVLYVEANGGSTPSVIVVVCPPEKGEELALKEVRTLKGDP